MATVPTVERHLKRLTTEAHAAAKRRGHSMSRFTLTRESYQYRDIHSHEMVTVHKATGTSECRACDAYVHVDTRPAPNGIDIGGDAVAINCPE